MQEFSASGGCRVETKWKKSAGTRSAGGPCWPRYRGIVSLSPRVTGSVGGLNQGVTRSGLMLCRVHSGSCMENRPQGTEGKQGPGGCGSHPGGGWGGFGMVGAAELERASGSWLHSSMDSRMATPEIRASCLRKGKWSPQIASDRTRLTASLLTQGSIPRRPVSGVLM